MMIAIKNKGTTEIISHPGYILKKDKSLLDELSKNSIDIITKGVYSPCDSRVKIANFLCPIWQLEGEKMLHDYNSLFLYQKHSKMRVLNIPIFYTENGLKVIFIYTFTFISIFFSF